MISLIIIIISFSLILAFIDVEFVPEINAQIIAASQLQQDPCPPGWSLSSSSGRCEEKQNGGLDTQKDGIQSAQESTTMLTFEDPNSGVTFQYPSNWQVKESVFDKSIPGIIDDIVYLFPVEKSSAEISITSVVPAGFSFDFSVQSYIQTKQAGLNTILSVSKTTVGDGHPAYEIVSQKSMSTDTTLEIITSIEGLEYYITYSAPRGVYNKLMPDVRQIQDSFKVSSIMGGFG